MNTYQLAGFRDELEKIAGEVKIPEGGLKPGLWMNDSTQMMTPEDAELVKKKLPFYRRSGPGIIPTALIGAGALGSLGRMTGSAVGEELGKKNWGRNAGMAGAALGGIVLPAGLAMATRAGKYDKKALEAAKKMIEKAKERQ